MSECINGMTLDTRVAEMAGEIGTYADDETMCRNIIASHLGVCYEKVERLQAIIAKLVPIAKESREQAWPRRFRARRGIERGVGAVWEAGWVQVGEFSYGGWEVFLRSGWDVTDWIDNPHEAAKGNE